MTDDLVSALPYAWSGEAIDRTAARVRLTRLYPSFRAVLDHYEAHGFGGLDVEGERSQRGLRYVGALATMVDAAAIASVAIANGRGDDCLAAAAVAAEVGEPGVHYRRVQPSESEALMWLGAYSVIADICPPDVLGWLAEALPGPLRRVGRPDR